MDNKKRYPIKNIIIVLSVLPSVVLILSSVILLSLGVGFQGTLIILLMSFPLFLFSVVYGFYKRLVNFHGFNEKEKLFFDGKF